MNENFKTWAFSIISWLFGIIFLLMGFINLEINTISINLVKLLLILIGFSLLIFHFISKFKIGNIIELERKIETSKTELSEFKSFVSSSLSVLSTNMNSNRNDIKLEIHNPSFDVLKTVIKINEELNKIVKLNNKVENNKNKLKEETKDKTWALIKTRIDIEKKLRLIIGKCTIIQSFAEKEVKFLTFEAVIRKFIEVTPESNNLKESFDYYRRIVNSVIHGQIIEDAYLVSVCNVPVFC